MDLLELLQAGNVEEFNLQRGQKRLELFAADLAGANLAGADLSGADLSKADLTRADLTEANLVKADLSGVDATGARLPDAMALRARLAEAWLEEADLTGADLSRAVLQDANLSRTQGAGLRLSRAVLKDVDAHGAVWPEVDLVEAQLHRADLTGADLTKADLTEATGSGVKLAGAKLDGATAVRARLPGVHLARATLVGAKLEGADLSGADLTGADLSGADLTRANLAGARLDGARLQGAVLADAALEGVDLAGLDLQDVDLTGLDTRALGLTEEQAEGLAAAGASFDPDAPLRITDPAAARAGGRVALLWHNPESEEASSLRWALLGEASIHGVLPTSAEAVLARAVVPQGDGFLLVVLQHRPGGVALVTHALSPEGEVGPPVARPLGYVPATRPVLRVDGDVVWMWGLSQRGPGVVVQRLVQGRLEVAATAAVPTAQRFLGHHVPVLACKGGVVIPVHRDGVRPPMRTPKTFPGTRAAAVTVGERVMCLWVEPSKGRETPGGLRWAWLERRADPVVEPLGKADDVGFLEAVEVGGVVLAVWTERTRDGVVLCRAELPDGRREVVPVENLAHEAVGLALDALGDASVVAWSPDGAAAAFGLDGALVGTVGP